ncbi:hypothetical protein [Shouchella patagoniensis]|uniref:hypothetical protein n=1 Tax=Shouchella patagoniensis TaxID=228576 RepID=UPI0015D57A6B|nr:hypothetical protein [Shouchella patagoniensis]
MFSPFDWLRLLMSALFILPLTTIIRESGYYLAASILGGTNKKLIIGSGPILFSLKTVEVRRYFFMYSWMQYDELRPSNRFWHGFIYASPILTTGVCAFTVNSLILSGTLDNNIFWSTFIFYCFYFMLFDVIPVYLPDGQPTNGRAIFDLVWHGERSDYLKQKKEENDESTDNERSNTEEQEETMQHRDRAEEERGDHIDPENDEDRTESDSSDNEDTPDRGYTEAQEETIENRDRDEKERGDHTDPDNDENSTESDSSDYDNTHDRSQTEAQEETMKNRDRDEKERGDHTNPENDESHNQPNQTDKRDR